MINVNDETEIFDLGEEQAHLARKWVATSVKSALRLVGNLPVTENIAIAALDRVSGTENTP